MKVDPWPRLDRFKEHTLELPVGDLVVSAAHEGELRDLLAKALDLGKGVMHLLTPLTGLRASMLAGTPTRKVGQVKVFSTKRACPTCGTSYPELDPRMFSYNSKHGWCTMCVGTGLEADARAAQGLRRLDPRRRRPRPRAELPGRGGRGRGRRRRAVPRVRRHAPEPGLAQGHVRGRVDRLDRAVVGHRRAEVGRGAGARRPRRRDRARRRQRDQEPPRVPRGGRPRLPDARPRRADALGRRGAAHPPRGAARLEPAGRLLRARRADDRPALARQRDPAQRAAERSPTRATRWSSSSTTRRRSGAPTTSSTSARARASAAAGWSPRAASSELASHADSVTGRFLAHPLVHPLQPRRPVAAVTAATERKESASQRAADDPRRDAAQPAGRDGRPAAQAPGRDHRRQRLGQVDARARRAARQPAVHQHARRAAELAGLREDRRLGLDRPRARGRPDADRQDAALVPGDLHRLLGHDPQALRRDARSRRRAATRRRASASTPARAAARAAKGRA